MDRVEISIREMEEEIQENVTSSLGTEMMPLLFKIYHIEC
jgi:hypothetical protein